MPAPVKPPKPLAHDKFMSGVIHKSAWPTTSTAPHSFSWKRAWFCQPRWVGASQVWQMPPLLHRCKRRKAQRNWIWLQNLCKAFMSFWLPWTIPQAEQYLLNIAANYILYKMQEFFYFPHKTVCDVLWQLVWWQRIKLPNLCKFIESISIIYVQIWNTMIHQLENLISFKMVYYKPYLVSILDLDDFF